MQSGSLNQLAQIEDGPIVAALERLEKGAFMSVPVGGDTITRKVKSVADILIKRSTRTLTRMVGISLNLNEGVTAAAGMIRDMRHVQNQVHAMASAAEEMSASIETIAGNSIASVEESSDARTSAVEGIVAAQRAEEVMTAVVKAVQDAGAKVDALAVASEKIGEIVGSIEAIAKQTNLLALNATIEAARAGDAGKGFAVVAGEVKTLANQTTKATDDIRARIGQLRQDMAAIVDSMREGAQTVAQGQKIISDTVHSMQSVTDKVTGVTGKMKDLSEILGQQKVATSEISKGINTVARNTESNVTQAEQVFDALDRADAQLTQSMDEMGEVEIPDYALHRAKSDHVIWRKRLVEMVIGRTALDPATLADHHSCRLGKWYYSNKDSKVTSSRAYRDLEGPHAEVHKHGIEAARRFKDHDLDGALQQIALIDKPSGEVLKLLETMIGRGEN